jgi:hypothetical protein
MGGDPLAVGLAGGAGPPGLVSEPVGVADELPVTPTGALQEATSIAAIRTATDLTMVKRQPLREVTDRQGRH